MIEKNNSEKAYEQVKRDLKSKISNGYYQNGDQLPTNMQLCEMYHVSRITINRALMELEADGCIERVQGKGCFVRLKEINQNISNFYSFTEELIKMGYVPSSIFVSLKLEKPSEEIAKALDLGAEDKVYVITRLRLADEMIVAYDRSAIPVKFFPNFNKRMLTGGSLYKALEDNYGIKPNHSEETVEAIGINQEDAEKMRLKVGSPVLLIKRVSYYNEKKVEFNYRLVNSRLFKYHMSLR
jgi:GntR family transcriptional regulator